MKLAIASDHGGFELKKFLVEFLKERNLDVEDLGPDGADSVDYPDHAVRVAELVSRGKVEAGILVCGTGIGMSIAANKLKNVRAAVVTDEFTAQMSREHNNANVLCLGGRLHKPAVAQKLVGIWLDTKFAGGRHQRRLDQIAAIEKKNFKPTSSS